MIEHVERVAGRVPAPAQTIAYLHDVLERTSTSMSELREDGPRRVFGSGRGGQTVLADAVDAGAGSAPGAHHPVSVLVVDDHPSFRGVLRELVAATEGFDLVGEADSGEAALEAVAELSPRLVIMDKRMPGMGGVEAARVLTDRHPELVVLLTSLEGAPDPSLLQSCGAAAYVRKQELTPALLRELWRRHSG